MKDTLETHPLTSAEAFTTHDQGVVSTCLKLLDALDPEHQGMPPSWSLEPPPLLIPIMPENLHLEARRWLAAHESSPLVRAHARALLTRGQLLLEVGAADYALQSLVNAAAELPLRTATLLLSSWPNTCTEAVRARRAEEAGMLQLAAQEHGCWGATLTPGCSEFQLEFYTEQPFQRKLLANRLRHTRTLQPISSPWLADSLLPKLVRAETSAHLYMTVGPPLVMERAMQQLDIDVLVSADDIVKPKGPGDRRRQLGERVREHLRKGLRVACLSNHSTLEARRSLLMAARELGVPVTALYFDWSPEAVEALNAAAGWPVSARNIEHVLRILEAPLPQEVEEVWVMGPQGRLAQWQQNPEDAEGFYETLEPTQMHAQENDDAALCSGDA